MGAIETVSDRNGPHGQRRPSDIRLHVSNIYTEKCVLKASAAKYNSNTQPFVQVLVEYLLCVPVVNKTKKMPVLIMELRVQQRGLE